MLINIIGTSERFLFREHFFEQKLTDKSFEVATQWTHTPERQFTFKIGIASTKCIEQK